MELAEQNFRDLAMFAYFNGTWTNFDKKMPAKLSVASPAAGICASANDMKQYLLFLMREKAVYPSAAPPRQAVTDVLSSVSNFVPIYSGVNIAYATKATKGYSFGALQYNLGTFKGLYRGLKKILLQCHS